MRTIHLPVAEPCHEDWDAMDPRERGKFCQRCHKDVHDLSSMTEDEAGEFLRARAGTRVCVNYRYHDDGRIHFRTPGRAALAATALAATALAACAPHDRRKADPLPATTETVIAEPRMVVHVPEQPPPPPPPLQTMKGDVMPEPPPEPTQMRKGDMAVPNEPCDPDPRTSGVLGGATLPVAEPPKHAIRGDIDLGE